MQKIIMILLVVIGCCFGEDNKFSKALGLDNAASLERFKDPVPQTSIEVDSPENFRTLCANFQMSYQEYVEGIIKTFESSDYPPTVNPKIFLIEYNKVLSYKSYEKFLKDMRMQGDE